MNGPDLRSRPIIEVKNVRKEYPIGDETVVALKRINLSVSRGEICCIFGTSGSGKSTLLNQLAGMEKPTRFEDAHVRYSCLPAKEKTQTGQFLANCF